jgi:hypothetical protein
MEQAPENSKESSHSARDNGMNKIELGSSSLRNSLHPYAFPRSNK